MEVNSLFMYLSILYIYVSTLQNCFGTFCHSCGNSYVTLYMLNRKVKAVSCTWKKKKKGSAIVTAENSGMTSKHDRPAHYRRWNFNGRLDVVVLLRMDDWPSCI